MPWDKPYHPPKNQRLDPELYTHANRVYFMTVHAYMNQTPFVRADLNQLVLDVLCEEQTRQNCTVFTFCLMPNHLHFLVSPGRDGISALTFTDQFKGKATNASWPVNWRGKLWQPRYYDHIVRTEEDLQAISEYILNNPIRKGLVSNREDWQWGGQMNPLPY
ncbi:MAG: transposase [Chloroflexi bacterium]|nr:transposase [Chloroflexota bacterium]